MLLNITLALFLSISVLEPSRAQDMENYCRNYLKELDQERFLQRQRSNNFASRSAQSTKIATPASVDVDAALGELKRRISSYHSKCRDRHECYEGDLSIIKKYYASNASNSAIISLVDDFYRTFKKEFSTDKLSTESVLFNHLSAKGQQLYLSGITLKLPSFQNRYSNYSNRRQYADNRQYQYRQTEESEQLFYDVDEVLIAIIQQISKEDEGCLDRARCLEQDIRYIRKIQEKFDYDEDLSARLETVIEAINQRNNQDIFNTPSFIERYMVDEKQGYPTKYRSQFSREFEKIKSKRAMSGKTREVQGVRERNQVANKDSKTQLKAAGKEILNQFVENLAGKEQAPPQYRQRPQTAPAPAEKTKGGLEGLLGQLFGF